MFDSGMRLQGKKHKYCLFLMLKKGVSTKDDRVMLVLCAEGLVEEKCKDSYSVQKRGLLKELENIESKTPVTGQNHRRGGVQEYSQNP